LHCSGYRSAGHVTQTIGERERTEVAVEGHAARRARRRQVVAAGAARGRVARVRVNHARALAPAGDLERGRAVRDKVDRARRDLTVGRARLDGHRQVEAVDEGNVERVLAAVVAVHRPLGERRGRDARARLVVAHEAAVAAAGLAGERALAEVALRATPDATRAPRLGDVERDGRAGLLLPATRDASALNDSRQAH
jgi:hypothetical protein